MDKTMSWTNQGRLAVTVHSAQPPSDDEWDAYVAFIRSFRDLAKLRVIVVSHGGGPNGRQRHQLVEAIREGSAPVAMLTSNTLMRGIGTAIGWFNRNLKIYGLDAFEKAFDHLGLDGSERARARLIVGQLEAELGLESRAAATPDG